MLPRLASGMLAALACAAVAYSQAAVEYALKSAGSTVSGSGGHGTIGGCRVDSALLACLSGAYPKTTVIVIVLIALMIFRWLAKTYTSRR